MQAALQHVQRRVDGARLRHARARVARGARALAARQVTQADVRRADRALAWPMTWVYGLAETNYNKNNEDIQEESRYSPDKCAGSAQQCLIFLPKISPSQNFTTLIHKG